MITCIIIDDDELARELLKTYVSKTTFLESLGSFENPLDGLEFLKSNSVDILFLDIQMPEIKGTDFIKLLAEAKLKIILTTAYSEYAITAFELNVMDYLLKPITFNRFLSAVEKFPKKVSKNNVPSENIIIKSGYDLYKVSPQDILYIESYSEYVHYYLENGKKLTANQTLRKLLPSLPNSFIQVHRSYIVNGQKVSSLKGRELLINNFLIPVSNSYYDLVKSKLFS